MTPAEVDAMALDALRETQCLCNHFEPEPSTGHHWACPIHKAIIARGAAEAIASVLKCLLAEKENADAK